MFYKPPPPHEPYGLWGVFLQSFRENTDLEKAYMQGRFDAVTYFDESVRKY